MLAIKFMIENISGAKNMLFGTKRKLISLRKNSIENFSPKRFRYNIYKESRMLL